MKKYAVKPGEDLGSIARKYALASWKYLYDLNKDVIGDNPDLLKPGTELQIPQWDSTSGDEKIKAKEADPFDYTGGLRYRYPWVPFSLSLVDGKGEVLPEFEEDREYSVWRRYSKAVLQTGKMKKADEAEMLVPDAPDLVFGIKGMSLMVNGEQHVHPDDVLPAADGDSASAEIEPEQGPVSDEELTEESDSESTG